MGTRWIVKEYKIIRNLSITRNYNSRQECCCFYYYYYYFFFFQGRIMDFCCCCWQNTWFTFSCNEMSQSVLIFHCFPPKVYTTPKLALVFTINRTRFPIHLFYRKHLVTSCAKMMSKLQKQIQNIFVSVCEFYWCFKVKTHTCN